ncbi:hypothetical protein [Rubellimicrobium arenae]|uniref:hypothetical protein n=1 Tax=Rubellimicrobium arenae TaxID=2817372 RepID=UPI001B31093F|nr:hypothetical protein [Rubellimicrobium arenae]
MSDAVVRGPIYLIVLSQAFVALDLRMTIEEFDPTAPVVAATSTAEALPVLEGVDRIAVAFVDQGPGDYEQSALARIVAEKGGHVVLMGDRAEEDGAGHGYAVLERPFLTAHVADHLLAALG